MIVTIGPNDSKVLTAFLTDAQYLRMPKKYSQCLSKLRDEVKRGQVNSDRFNHALPVVRVVHSTLHTLVDQSHHWKRIARWKRIVLPLAVLEFLFRVMPSYLRARKQLNKVAVAVKALEERCSLKKAGGAQ